MGSGSRSWGFESTDSDYDVRFIHIRKEEEYLKLERIRDVTELTILAGCIEKHDIAKSIIAVDYRLLPRRIPQERYYYAPAERKSRSVSKKNASPIKKHREKEKSCQPKSRENIRETGDTPRSSTA